MFWADQHFLHANRITLHSLENRSPRRKGDEGVHLAWKIRKAGDSVGDFNTQLLRQIFVSDSDRRDKEREKKYNSSAQAYYLKINDVVVFSKGNGKTL